jgi:hypothetical protein
MSETRCEPRRDRTQTELLTRHFFSRFFDNELLSPGGEMTMSLTQILALICVPGALLSIWHFVKYAFLTAPLGSALAVDSWSDRCFYVSLAMILMGLITVIEWDTLFPDRRDYLNLAPLPVTMRTFFLAKIASLLLFMALFSTAVNGFPALFFPLAATASKATAADGLRFLVAHSVSVLSASAFVFLSLVALHGLCLTVLPRRLFVKISALVQPLLLVALLSLLFIFPQVVDGIRSAGNRWYVALFVPAWFTGLYDRMIGIAPLHGWIPWWLPIGALVLVGLLALVLYEIAYRRYVAGTLDTEPEPAKSRSVTTLLLRGCRRLLVRQPDELAGFDFTAATLLRSRSHRVVLGSCLGVALALGLASAFSIMAQGGSAGFAKINLTLLLIPAMFTYLLLGGLRFAFTVPSDLKANWVFRLNEGLSYARYWCGVRKAVFALVLAPLHLLLGVSLCFVWPLGVALQCLLFQVLAALVLMEWFFRYYPKLPFTCSYLPGKGNLKLYWPVHVVGFLAYTFLPAIFLFLWYARPIRYWAMIVLAILLAARLMRVRERYLSRSFVPIFEDRNEEELISLGRLRLSASIRCPVSVPEKA